MCPAEDETYIVRRPDVGDIIRTGDPDALTQLLEDPLPVIVGAVTEWLLSPKAFVAAAGRIVQSAWKARIFPQVAREIKQLKEAGKIPDDFADKKYGFQTWVELMTVIDEDAPDEERLEALKAMFFAVNKVTASDAERIVGYQLFQIAKKLSSGELLVLKAVHELLKKGTFFQDTGIKPASIWASAVAGHLGHSITALALYHEAKLMETQLITPRTGQTADAVTPANGRLTDLGLRFCSNLETYQIEKPASSPDPKQP